MQGLNGRESTPELTGYSIIGMGICAIPCILFWALGWTFLAVVASIVFGLLLLQSVLAILLRDRTKFNMRRREEEMWKGLDELDKEWDKFEQQRNGGKSDSRS